MTGRQVCVKTTCQLCTITSFCTFCPGCQCLHYFCILFNNKRFFSQVLLEYSRNQVCGSGFCDQMLAVKSRKTPENQFVLYTNKNSPNKIRFLHISSGYAKIWREIKCQPRECPRSGSKAIDVERRKKENKSVITMVSTCRLNQCLAK